ncbi:hypothetical protein [Oceaniferula spumae]
MKNISNAFIASTVVLGAVVLFQFKQSSDLKQQNEELQSAANSRSASIHLPNRDAETRFSKRSNNSDSAAGQTHSIRHLLAIRNPTERTQALLDYVKNLPASEIPEAIAELRRSTPHWDQEGKFFAHMLISKWARLDPDAALASLKEIDMKRYGDAPFSVISSIASQDPQRAITWLNDDQNPFASNKWMGQFLAGTISKEWVKQDPEAALEWARNVPSDQRIGALTGVLGSIAMTDPQRAAKLAMEIEGDGREHVLADIAQSWAAKDPRGALAWVESLSDDERPRALNNTLAIWARTEPNAAAEYVAMNLDADKSHKLVKSVTEAWVAKAPDEAAKWIATLPVDEKGAKAMSDAMWHWTNKNPKDAATWLADQPAGPVRDQGITGLAKASFEFDKAAALSWTREISDQKTRNFSTDIGLKAWIKEDPQAATAWARANGVAIPEEK